MKNRLITGIGAIILGLLISLGPKTILKLCEAESDGNWPKCHWTGQAELGIGLLIAVLGVLLLTFSSKRTRLGLSLAVVLGGILVLLFPTVLIGGCAMKDMPCQRITFPALILSGIITVIGFTFNTLFLLLSGRNQEEGKD
ncbi:MAG TPA: DUF4418 domain-containing protein [Firmicutes bacterium]|jgi:hypothetical protein|nr:DUF4418 domain-containing protein [Bacillota bacterium]